MIKNKWGKGIGRGRGHFDSTELAQDRNKWQVFLNKVTNFGVSQFLTS